VSGIGITRRLVSLHSIAAASLGLLLLLLLLIVIKMIFVRRGQHATEGPGRGRSDVLDQLLPLQSISDAAAATADNTVRPAEFAAWLAVCISGLCRQQLSARQIYSDGSICCGFVVNLLYNRLSHKHHNMASCRINPHQIAPVELEP